MTQEDKELLLKDLCARLPYGVKAIYYGAEEEGECIDVIEGVYPFDNEIAIGQYGLKVEAIKPYLFPLSSMTEEQREYVGNRWGVNEDFDFEIDPNYGTFFVELRDTVDFINWCYENHFDIYGLIPKGFGIDATGKNIY